MGPGQVVLVVDDDDTLRTMMARALADEGFRVLTAPCGEDALLLARSLGGGLPLVITDIRMPRMDGLELASHLARLNPTPQVLFVSGFAAALGGELPGPVLAKPFSPYELADRVRRMLAAGEGVIEPDSSSM